MSRSTSERIDLGRRRFLGSAASGLALTRLASGSTKPDLPIEGQLPALRNATSWLNSPPLTVADLRGKVVLVNFCTYTCINWLRSLPYVRAWSMKYKDQGLAVIGVHTPEFAFEKDTDNVRRAVAGMGIEYPVAIDNDYAIWRSFNNQYWPALYFADAKVRIRHHRFGEGEYEHSEAVIQQLLRDAGARGVADGLVSINARGLEAAADWRNLQTPENYLGYQRTQGFASPGAAARNKSRRYTSPAQLPLNHWALTGDWTAGKEALVLNEAGGRILYGFHARDLHLVTGPAQRGTAVRFRVSVDGNPPGIQHGADVDAQGYGTITAPRLYQLIRQTMPIVDRHFEIEFLDAGAEAFAFTFG